MFIKRKSGLFVVSHFVHPSRLKVKFSFRKPSAEKFISKSVICFVCLFACYVVLCVHPHGLSLIVHPSRWKAKFPSEHLPLKSFHFKKDIFILSTCCVANTRRGFMVPTRVVLHVFMFFF